MAGDVDVEAREKLINALAGGANHSEAARVSGYSRKHVKSLAKSDEFMALVAERRAASGVDFSEAVRTGLATLLEVARNKDARDQDRVNAAKILVGMDAPKAKTKQAEAPAPAASGPEPTPEELQRNLRVLA